VAIVPREVTAGEARTVERSGLVWLSVLAVLLSALILVTPSAFRTYGDNAYIGMALTMGVVAALATSVAQRAPSVRALWLILAVAALLRLCLLILDPLLSSDIYRYVWDGKVQAAGINPYRYVPADPVLAGLRDVAVYPRINRADYAVTIYPPVAQMFFVVVTRFGENVTTMKAALLLCEAGIIGLILLLLRCLGRPLTRVVAYAWHPLPLWEIASSGHVDALMVALMMLGLWLAFGGRPVSAAVAVALAALVKPLAVLALPACWRPWDWRAPLAVTLTAALCYAPYLGVGWGVFGFLTTGYLEEEHYLSGEMIWPLATLRGIAGSFHGDLTLYYGISALLIGLLALRVSWRSYRSPKIMLADINRLLLAGLFLISPNFPWYFLIATPFVALVGGPPVWAMTMAAVLLQEEIQWDSYFELLDRKTVLYGMFIIACLFTALRPWFRKGLAHGSA
jgi:alpha-1,6-mannosyltransferase